MTRFFELLVSGLLFGCVYALISMGFVIVFKATNVVNFAHVSVLMLGAFIVAKLNREDVEFLLAVGIAAVVCGIVAALLDVIVVGPLRRRGGGIDALAIITIGLNIVLATELTRQVGVDTIPSGAPWGNDTTEFLGVTVQQTRVAAAITAVILMTIFAIAFKYSDWGVAMRSTADDPETAALMGIRLSRVAMGAWAVSGLLAAIAGAYFISFPAPGVTNATYLLALTAIPAAVLGGLDSTVGAVVGGLIIGAVVTLTAGYQDELSFLGRGLNEVAPYVVLLVVLLWRPWGLFGTREVTRV